MKALPFGIDISLIILYYNNSKGTVLAVPQTVKLFYFNNRLVWYTGRLFLYVQNYNSYQQSKANYVFQTYTPPFIRGWNNRRRSFTVNIISCLVNKVYCYSYYSLTKFIINALF